MNDIFVREYTTEDIPFIISNWLTHFKQHSQFAQRIRNNVFFKYHEMKIHQCLNHEMTKGLIACDKDDLDVLFGFMIFQKVGLTDVIHYTFIKEPFRKFGLARELFKTSRIDIGDCAFSHWPYDVDQLVNKFTKMTYNPYLFGG